MKLLSTILLFSLIFLTAAPLIEAHPSSVVNQIEEVEDNCCESESMNRVESKESKQESEKDDCCNESNCRVTHNCNHCFHILAFIDKQEINTFELTDLNPNFYNLHYTMGYYSNLLRPPIKA